MLQRELYNAALEERREAWKWEGRSVSYFEQTKELTELRELRPETLAFGVTVCRAPFGGWTGPSRDSSDATGSKQGSTEPFSTPGGETSWP